MTKRNKLIVGAVVVIGGLYALNQYRKKKVVADLKDGANTSVETEVPVGTTGIKSSQTSTIKPMSSALIKRDLTADSIQVKEGGNLFSNFAGKRGNSYFETIF
jgi:ribonucleotide reductase alpha subunit